MLIRNATVFDGEHEELQTRTDVLVEGGRISKVARGIPAPARGEVIDADERVLMPGMSDMHWHSMFATLPVSVILRSEFGYLSHVAARANRDLLLRGFTSVRDVGGNVFGLKKATDEGLLAGPRIWPSGSYLSQTAGHGDFRGPNEVPVHPGAPLDYFQSIGMTMIADGVPEVTKRAREILRQGASQLKVMAGGGVSSLYDPLDTIQYSFEELKAIVDAARNWNTYVAIHAFNDASVRQAIDAGVLCVDHGFLIGEETVDLMAKKGVWLSIQPLLDDEDAISFEDPVSRAKWVETTQGTDRVYALAKAKKVKVAFGTDSLFSSDLAAKQGRMVAKLARWFTPFEALKMVVHDNAQLLALSGPRNPYPGKLGVIEEGAHADLLLVNGNPLEDINIISDSKNLALIMKGGRVYKDEIRQATRVAALEPQDELAVEEVSEPSRPVDDEHPIH